jgi:hypothetical protein
MLHLILLGGAFLRRSAAKTLQENRLTIEENNQWIKEKNEEQYRELKAELDLIQAEVNDLQASFPNLGAPFAIFPKGMDLAQNSQVELQSISSNGVEIQETTSGTVQTERYSIELNGSLSACLTFIRQLEQAGMETVALEYLAIYPEEELCSLEIMTVGYSQTME